MKCIDLIGKNYGRLIVLSREANNGPSAQWLCKCTCGNTKIVPTARLNNGQCKSCGCLMKETVGNRFRKHGQSRTTEYKILKDARKRAKQLNRDYNIELSDVIIPKICPILNIEIIVSKSGNSTDNSPSLDRIDSSKGYVKGNIRVISMRANRIKQDSTIEELQRLILYMQGKI